MVCIGFIVLNGLKYFLKSFTLYAKLTVLKSGDFRGHLIKVSGGQEGEGGCFRGYF